MSGLARKGRKRQVQPRTLLHASLSYSTTLKTAPADETVDYMTTQMMVKPGVMILTMKMIPEVSQCPTSTTLLLRETRQVLRTSSKQQCHL